MSDKTLIDPEECEHSLIVPIGDEDGNPASSFRCEGYGEIMPEAGQEFD
jgi:hypothetical protein